MLKRLLTIALLVLYLFNLAGYQLMFQYFIGQSNKHLVQQLDNHQYHDEQLIEIKIPLHLPYMTNWSDYERVDGEVEVAGTYYNYVKRKISNDTLYLQCIPNDQKAKLHAARNDYAKQANDLPADKKGKPAASKKSTLVPEYQSSIPHYNFATPLRVAALQAGALVAHLIDPANNTPWHPPQRIS